MKIGSIVECVRAIDPSSKTDDVINPKVPAVKERLLVTDIAEMFGEIYLCFDGYGSLGYHQDNFREIEFPPSMEVEIKECLTRELELI